MRDERTAARMRLFGPGTIIALAAAAVIGFGRYQQLAVRAPAAEKTVVKHAPALILQAESEADAMLADEAELKLTPEQTEALHGIDARWKKEFPPIKKELERLSREFEKFMNTDEGRNASVKLLEEKMGPVSTATSGYLKLRSDATARAMEALTAPQREKWESLKREKRGAK